MNALNTGQMPVSLKRFAQLVAVAVGFALIGTGGALAVTCPNTPGSNDQEFTLTPSSGTATCLTSGTNNLNPGVGTAGTGLLAGYTVLDTTSTNSPLTYTGVGQNSGTYTLQSGIWSSFSSLVLALVSYIPGGEDQQNVNPDWYAFVLPSSSTSGSWSLAGAGINTLDRAILYGVAAVPLPAGIVLLGGGLGMLAMLGRRRRGSKFAAA